MLRTAIILTVYNRKDVTLQGLRLLYGAIRFLGEGYAFDIYMTDDGCTDGTSEAVSKEFPDVKIFKGNGSLYWSGGMRRSWQAAIDSEVNYDFFLWFNDDVELFEDALISIFDAYDKSGSNAIITGAFCNHEGVPSYGGKLDDIHAMEPNGELQDVTLMNGNFVLIPYSAFFQLGMIDKVFRHGIGDCDYGLRARKKKIKVLLAAKYVGICDRHDKSIPVFFSRDLTLKERFRELYSPQNNPFINFVYIRRHFGLVRALRELISIHKVTFFPFLFKPSF